MRPSRKRQACTLPTDDPGVKAAVKILHGAYNPETGLFYSHGLDHRATGRSWALPCRDLAASGFLERNGAGRYVASPQNRTDGR